MNYQEFKEYIAEHIKEYLPDSDQDADIILEQVTKNNGTIMDRIQIRHPEDVFYPSIYLDNCYIAYQNGISMEEVLRTIAEIRETEPVRAGLSVREIEDYLLDKNRVIFQVVNRKMNKELLRKVPHRVELDMALIFKIMVNKGEQGLHSIAIDYALMEKMGVDTDTLYELAMHNTQREFPIKLSKMDDIIADIWRKEGHELTEKEKAYSCPTWVLSNEDNINGASVLFYPGVQKMMAQRVGGDFFVLPSSIHETLILSCDSGMTAKYARGMVSEVNESAVLPEEVLSDQVYRYDSEFDRLYMTCDLQTLIGQIIEYIQNPSAESVRETTEMFEGDGITLSAKETSAMVSFLEIQGYMEKIYLKDMELSIPSQTESVKALQNVLKCPLSELSVEKIRKVYEGNHYLEASERKAFLEWMSLLRQVAEKVEKRKANTIRIFVPPTNFTGKKQNRSEP